MQDLLPHLSRAAELHRTMIRLQDQHGAVIRVLDMLLEGLVIADASGRVVVANRAACEIAEQTGALNVGTTDGRLTTWQPMRDEELRKLLAETSQTSNGNGRHEGGTVVLPKRSGTGCLLLEVLPLNDEELPDGDGVRGSAVFVLDPHHSHVVSLAGLAKIFELTESEHQIASALANGATPGEIADRRGRSLETVRSQIKRVFSKTGTRSQLGLLRLAVKANPPIAAKQGGEQGDISPPEPS